MPESYEAAASSPTIPPPTGHRSEATAAAPLALAYLLLPLSGRFLPAITGLRAPDWLPMDWPWLALAGMGLLSAVAARLPHRKSQDSELQSGLPIWSALLLVACGALLALAAVKLSYPRLQGPFFPTERFLLVSLPETAPLIFMLLAGTWAATFGAPGRVWFRRFGAILGGLALADVLLSSVLAGFLLPGGTLLESGQQEQHAFLLGLALLLGVDDEQSANRFPGWQALLTMGGVLGCGSPVPLLATGAAYLFLSNVRIEARIGFALACAGGVAGPLFSGSAASMDGRMQVYMTWLAGLESFAEQPLALLRGFGPWPLDFRLPEQAATALGMPDVSFSLPPRAVPSFWLRAALVWGALPPLALLLTSVALTAVTPGRAMAAIMALALTQGVIFPLLYDGSSAVALFLAVACLLSAGIRVLRQEEAVAEPPAAPEAGPGPAEQAEPERIPE